MPVTQIPGFDEGQFVVQDEAAMQVGTALGRFTGRSRLGTALRQLAFVAVPAAVTFGIGSAVGVGVS